MDFETIKNRWNWQPIRNCPGRFVLKSEEKISVETLLGFEVEAKEFHSRKARDKVVVVKFEDGGLISYRREDNSLLHTLNTEEGFERKLEQLEIKLTEK